MGHAGTWPFPVLYRVVRGASPDRMVRHDAPVLFEAFLAAGREPVRDGADAITTNRGFLSVLQEPLARRLDVPVAASSLMQVPLVAATLPPQRTVGIVSVSKESLTPRAPRCRRRPCRDPARQSPGARCRGSPHGGGRAAMDLKRTVPGLGAVVLECTNMDPYAADIRKVTGVLVHSIRTCMAWFRVSLEPAHFAPA